jgi:uncharacterized GH25 family protein
MIRWPKGLLALGFALGVQPLLAHDVWIEPSSFSPVVGQTVALRLRVGQDLQGEPLALVPGLANRFVFHDPARRVPIVPRLRAETAGLVRVANDGLQIVGYFSNPSFIELPAEKFNAYLAEEGLETIITRRSQRNEANAKGRELYSRCVKSVILSGVSSEAQKDVRLGFPLELVAERNPYEVSAAQELPIRLMYEDRPLPGALVVALNSLDPSAKQAARTDSDGRVRFRVGPGGMWLVKAVHMVQAPAGNDADWASYWASLTFDSSATSGDRTLRQGATAKHSNGTLVEAFGEK